MNYGHVYDLGQWKKEMTYIGVDFGTYLLKEREENTPFIHFWEEDTDEWTKVSVMEHLLTLGMNVDEERYEEAIVIYF